MVLVANKVRRGDVVAIEVNHSYHSLKEGRKTYTTAHLAKVESAERNGLAKRIILAEGYASIHVTHASRVMTIAGSNQPLARQAFAALTREANSFESLEALKAHMLALGATQQPQLA